LGASYRRLSARTGKVKGITATARKIAVLFYHALRPGGVSYETRYRARVIDNLHRGAKAFGFVLPAPGAVSLEIILQHQLADLRAATSR
jgi:hypothetical protein